MRIMKNGLMEWDRQEMPESEIRGRIQAVQKIMADQKLDALIIFSQVSESGAVSYFSNLAVFANKATLILPGAGDGILITDLGRRDAVWAKSTLLTDDIRPGVNTALECSKVLKEVGLPNNRVGIVEWKLFPYITFADLQKSFPGIEFIDITGIVNELRSVKSPVEIKLVEKATQITNQSWQSTLADWQYTKECELASQFEHHARLLACQDIFTLVISDEDKNLWLHPPTEKKLGKEISVEIMVEYKHYWAAKGRTIVPANADSHLLNLKKIGETAYAEAIRNLQAGESIQSVFNALSKAVKDGGTKVLANASFGLGMAAFDRVWMSSQDIDKNKGLILKEDMEVILQLSLLDKARTHTFLVEDTFIVKKGGPIRLTGE